MNALKGLGLAPMFALLLLVVLALPGSARAEIDAVQYQAAADTTLPDTLAQPDSLQGQAPDSVQAQPESTTPPPAAAPAAGAATTAPPPAATPPPATPPPATTPPPAAAAPSTSTQTAPPPATTAPPAAQSTAPAGRKEPFSKGTTRVSITGGWGRSFDEDYLMLGVGMGRFIRNGLNIGMDFEAWLFGDPGVFKISPNVNYVLNTPRRTKPYVGGFWRRTLIEDQEDLSSVGAKAGAYFKGAGPAMIGAGGVWENYLDCDETQYQNCTQFYPEFVISVSF